MPNFSLKASDKFVEEFLMLSQHAKATFTGTFLLFLRMSSNLDVEDSVGDFLNSL